MSHNILITGGSGLLGGELKKIIPDAYYPTSSEFNVCNLEQMKKYLENKSISTIFHGAAFTSPPKINEDPNLAINTNIIGTANLTLLCSEFDIKLVYICTDYVFKGDKGNYQEEDELLPQNKYAWSKLGGECAVRLYDKSLIVRASFSENEFPYPKAFIDQWTSRETAGA